MYLLVESLLVLVKWEGKISMISGCGEKFRETDLTEFFREINTSIKSLLVLVKWEGKISMIFWLLVTDQIPETRFLGNWEVPWKNE